MQDVRTQSEQISTSQVTVKRTKYRWFVLAIIFVSYVCQFADRANIAVIIPGLRKEFTMTNLEAGLLMSFFFLGYVLTQIPSSLLYRKYGTRWMVPLSILGFSGFTYLIGTVNSIAAIKWLRLGLGMAEGPSPIGVTTTINNWFPPKEKATAIGFGYVGPTMLAPVIVPPLCVWIMVNFGWRHVFYWFAIPGFIVALSWYLLVKNKPEESPFCSAAEVAHIRDTEELPAAAAITEKRSPGRFDAFLRVKPMKLLDTSRSVFVSKNIWGVAFGYMLLIIANNGMLTWIPSYLVSEKHYSFIRMGFMSALPWVGGFLGATVGGWLSDKVFAKRRKPTMLITTLSTAILMIVLVNAPEDTFLVGLILFTIGFFLHLGYPGFTAYTMGIADQKTYPTAIALVNSVGNLGGFFSPIIAGIILDTFKVYSAAFAFFGLAALLAFGCIFALNEPEQ